MTMPLAILSRMCAIIFSSFVVFLFSFIFWVGCLWNPLGGFFSLSLFVHIVIGLRHCRRDELQVVIGIWR
jgi:hypothetical protein